MLSPLQVHDVVLEEIAVVRGLPLRRGSRPPRQLHYNVGVDFDVVKRPRKGGPASFEVQLSLALELARPRRGASVQKVVSRLRGVFSFAPGTPDDLLNQLVPANCLAVLYGILRGIVLQDTGVCPGGGFLLPMLDMYEVVRRKSAKGPVTGALKAETPPQEKRVSALRSRSRSQPPGK